MLMSFQTISSIKYAPSFSLCAYDIYVLFYVRLTCVSFFDFFPYQVSHHISQDYGTIFCL